MSQGNNEDGAGISPATELTPPPSPKPSFDFADFDLQGAAEKGTLLRLLNPKTGAPTGVEFRVHGADARSYRVALRRMRDSVAAAPEREPTDEDDSVLLVRAREAACALFAWENVVLTGEPVEFSTEAAVQLFVSYPWAADQVLAFINNRGNF